MAEPGKWYTLADYKRYCVGWDSERWCAYFWFVGWDCISFGVHICLSQPNVELHLPFGFIRIGMKGRPRWQ